MCNRVSSLAWCSPYLLFLSMAVLDYLTHTYVDHLSQSHASVYISISSAAVYKYIVSLGA